MVVTDNLIHRVMEDTGCGRLLSEEIALRLTSLPVQLTDAVSVWLERYMTEEELGEVRAGGISILDVMRQEKLRFVEAVFTLDVLDKDPSLAADYFRLGSRRK